jgi:hypothetical protein
MANQKSNLRWQLKSPILCGKFKKVQSYVAIYLSNVVRFLHCGNMPGLALTPVQFIFLVLSGSYTCDNLSSSCACNIHLSNIARFSHLLQFVRLLRLRHLSFQFCPALTHETTYPFVYDRPSSLRQSILGPTLEPAAISQSPCKQRRPSLLIFPL